METQLDFFGGEEEPKPLREVPVSPEKGKDNIISFSKARRRLSKPRNVPTKERQEDCPLCGGSGPCYRCKN
ncbi:MAG: hypothetical protein NTV48_00440 [Candidatus Vogelbacteria bacterium]|nr:hypothetical protein [Candidatus Vogelbacteria bacterium]